MSSPLQQIAPFDWWRPEPAPAAAGAAPARLVLVESTHGRFAFAALVGFTFVLFIAPQQIIPALAPLRIAFFCAAGAIGGHLVNRWRHPPSAPLSRELKIAVALVLWAAVTIPFSHWPGGSVSRLLDVYTKSVIVFWLLSEVVTTRRRLWALMWTLSLISLPLAVTGLKNYLSGTFFVGQRILGYGDGIASNPNDLALTLNIILPLTVALALHTKSAFLRTLLVLVALVSVPAIIVTFSRGGFLTLAAIVIMLIFALMKRAAWIGVAGVALLGLMAIPLMPSGYAERLETVTSIQSDSTHSAQSRWADMVGAVKYVSRHPVIGAGIGMDIMALNETRPISWVSVHNAYLIYGVDLGLGALIAFAILVWTSIRSALTVERRASEGGDEARELKLLAGAIRISLVGFAIAAMLHPTAYNFYFFYLAGLAVALKGMTHAAGAAR